MQKKHVAYATHLLPGIWLCEILFSIMGNCFAFSHDRKAFGRSRFANLYSVSRPLSGTFLSTFEDGILYSFFRYRKGAGNTLIEVQNLVKVYGKHLAVDHLSFKVERGKIYGFLGPNGAGKSTTMNIMTGYLGATEGKVLINGHDILREPEQAKRSIGYLPELPPLYPEMTVVEYLCFVAELKKIPKRDRQEQIQRVIELTKLEHVCNRQIQNLSKGYKQRVGLAQAMLGFPEIIILDEPTVGLDPKQIIEIRELIRNLAQNHTVILSSHILAEVREVCDYIMIIADGKLVASDTPENLEEKMGGDRSIEIQANIDRERMEEILGTVCGIRQVEYRIEADQSTTARIESEDHKDIREEIFEAFAQWGQPLRTLMMTKMTLEEIFLELTQGKVMKREDEGEQENISEEKYTQERETAMEEGMEPEHEEETQQEESETVMEEGEEEHDDGDL